jgi:hypothetical protein
MHKKIGSFNKAFGSLLTFVLSALGINIEHEGY